MLNIYICEDEASQREFLQDCITHNKISKNDKVNFIGAYGTPTDLIKSLTDKSTNDIGLYFLDIDLNADMDGFELATYIRKYDPRGFIVIVTTHSEMLPLTFQYMIEPLGYIIKDSKNYIENQINDCICKAFSRYETLINLTNENKTITFSRGSRNFFVITDDIIYITLGHLTHTLEILTNNSIFEARGNLSNVYKLLPSNFMQISRETIINLDFIEKVDTNTHIVTLRNGDSFCISHRSFKSLIIYLSKRDAIVIK
ncbi:MAG: response regulator transcription factor [Lachnospiraceae bacterium]|nr:response regulator transcription factor [Lachnospiraceae bacterium]